MLGVNPGSARIGQTIAGRYKLESLIGVGGFGAVYKARHVTMGTTVALKILHAEHCAEPTAVKRFELEATRSASLVHPNSIKVFDFGRTETGEFYLAMEHLEGRTLSSLIHREGHVAPDRTVHILAQILRALDEAHLKGIIHRDLKPDNIFLLEIGHEHDFVKVLDYGISKATDASQSGLTAVGQIIGTPVYMSPEQCMGKPLDGRSDLYAIGCIAYHMLAGRPPFLADEGLMYALQHVQEEPVDVRDMAGPDHPIPTGLALWVHKLLAKAPADRYESAHLALDALSSAPHRAGHLGLHEGRHDAGPRARGAAGGAAHHRPDARRLGRHRPGPRRAAREEAALALGLGAGRRRGARAGRGRGGHRVLPPGVGAGRRAAPPPTRGRPTACRPARPTPPKWRR
ncbi:MAG: serine/threonine-protein kinase [Myxococcota bacterium]